MSRASFRLFLLLLAGCVAIRSAVAQTYFLNDSLRIVVNNPYFGKDSTVGNWHPSVVYFPNGWGKYHAKYWMAWTPNKISDPTFENPCIAYSNDGIYWDTTGLSNPIVGPSGLPGDYNADTQLFYNPVKDTLYMAYKARIGLLTSIKQSGNGVDWGSHKYGADTRNIIKKFNYKGNNIELICPVVTVEDSAKKYYLYARLGQTYTENWGFVKFTVDDHFRVLDTTYFDFIGNTDSVNAWHYDVVKNPKDDHYYFFTDGALHNGAEWWGGYIWLAKSLDTSGTMFTYYQKPLLKKGLWYRVTALFIGDTLELWWGSINGYILHQEVSFKKLQNWLTTTSYDSSSGNYQSLPEDVPVPKLSQSVQLIDDYLV